MLYFGIVFVAFLVEGGKMITQRNMVTLNKQEVDELIDRECKRRLGMSADEFLQKCGNGGLEKSIAVHDIEILLNLA